MAYRSRYFAGGMIHTVPPEMVFPHTWVDDDARRSAVRRRYERRKANTVGKRYNLAEVAERDGYTCHICGDLVDMSISGREPLGPTADHLLPVSAGGGDEPENIALAHSRCNIKRGVRPLATA